MKKPIIITAVIAFFVLLIAGIIGWPAIRFLNSMRAQMQAGQTYMDSLTEADIPVWISRTKDLLAKYDPNAARVGTYGSEGKPISVDLQQLKIVRIDVYDSNRVGYVWLGGMDHTLLEVTRKDDGSYEFVACYNDKTSKVIWPKK